MADTFPMIAGSSDKPIPHNLEAEISLLGAVLFDNQILGEVQGVLKPEYFYSKTHETLYRILLEHYQQNRAIDPTILRDALKTRGQLEAVGGEDYIASLVAEVFSTANAVEYAKIIREKALRADLIRVCSDIVGDAFSNPEDVDKVLDASQDRIFRIAAEERMGEVSEIGTVIHSLLEVLGTKGRTGIRSGYYDLDEFTNGFKAGEMIILAARPSVGKSTLAMNIAHNVAVNEKLPVLFFSLEMPEEQVAQNLIVAHTRIDSDKLMKRKLSDADWGRLSIAAGELAKAPFYIVDKPSINALEIRAIARRMKKEKDLGLVIIDYLQIMGVPDIDKKNKQSRENEISSISAAVKSLARTLDVPIIVLCQLNRDVEKRGDNTPKLHDLRESGSIEQDADVVLLLAREKYGEATEPGQGLASTLHVAKNRNGRVGKVEMNFFPSRLKFENKVELT